MLLVSTLSSNILSIFNKKLTNNTQIASELAFTYQRYAMTGMGMLGEPPILTGSEHFKLRSAFQALMNGRYPAGQAANAIGSAITQFWLAPPVLTLAGGASTTIVVSAGVAQLMSTNVNSMSAAANALASALDTMTKTVFLVYPYPLPVGFLK